MRLVAAKWTIRRRLAGEADDFADCVYSSQAPRTLRGVHSPCEVAVTGRGGAAATPLRRLVRRLSATKRGGGHGRGELRCERRFGALGRGGGPQVRVLPPAHINPLAVGRMPRSSGQVGRKALSSVGLDGRRSRPAGAGS